MTLKYITCIEMNNIVMSSITLTLYYMKHRQEKKILEFTMLPLFFLFYRNYRRYLIRISEIRWIGLCFKNHNICLKKKFRIKFVSFNSFVNEMLESKIRRNKKKTARILFVDIFLSQTSLVKTCTQSNGFR